MRKGIHQGISADGRVIADERWQFVTLADGSVQFDNETTRIAPFPEPRSDSVTFMLDPQLGPQMFAVHGLFGHREGRVGWTDGAAFSCWQYGLATHRREHAWTAECEIDFASPFFATAIVWRSRLAAGQQRDFRVMRLDAVTFEPTWHPGSLRALGPGTRRTVFGSSVLQHFALTIANDISELWADNDGIIFEMAGAHGGHRLAAVNFP